MLKVKVCINDIAESIEMSKVYVLRYLGLC